MSTHLDTTISNLLSDRIIDSYLNQVLNLSSTRVFSWVSLVQPALGCWLLLLLAPMLLCVSTARTMASYQVPVEAQARTPGEGEWACSQFGRKIQWPPGSVSIQVLAGLWMLSGSAEAGAFSHEWANISCQPESPEIYGWFVCGSDVPSSQISGVFLILSLL